MFKMPEPDQKDVLASITTLQAACSVLSHMLRESGQTVPAPPIQTKDILLDFQQLENYHATLAGILARKPSFVAAPPSGKSARADEQSPAAPAALPAPGLAAPSVPVSAELSRDEIKALTWTERVELAGGKITLDQCRERIAARAPKAQAKAGKPSLTAQVLSANGVESLSQLRAKQSANPNPKMD